MRIYVAGPYTKGDLIMNIVCGSRSWVVVGSKLVCRYAWVHGFRDQRKVKK